MSQGDLTIVRDYLPSISEDAEALRDNFVATLTLTGLLVAAFQIEVILAGLLGYSSSMAMLNAPSWEYRRVLGALLGPFLHQGPEHLVDNLGVLLLTAGYLEYEYNRSHIYLFYLIAGYFALLPPLILNLGGAVGASGATFGLSSWILVHSIGRILEMAWESELDLRILHSLPVLFALAKAQVAMQIMNQITGTDDLTHLLGAMIGLFLGIHFTLNYHDIQLIDR